MQLMHAILTRLATLFMAVAPVSMPSFQSITINFDASICIERRVP